VNVDSVGEARVLAPLGRELGWRMGLRISTRAEENFEFPGVRSQFGLLGAEVGEAARVLRRNGLEVGVVHFHLRTNVPEARYYGEAAEEALARATEAGVEAPVLDVGGGFPPERVASRKGAALDAGFSLASMREVLVRIRARHRHVREIWMENGRWLAAPTGVLAVRVLEVKEGRGRGMRTVICDGGRTLHAIGWRRGSGTRSCRWRRGGDRGWRPSFAGRRAWRSTIWGCTRCRGACGWGTC
jgi:diaminopimelate decarboxylase